MSQSDSLRQRREQHKPKNARSKADDSSIIRAIAQTIAYLKQRFDFDRQYPDHAIVYEKELTFADMIEFVRSERCRLDFDMRFAKHKILPDGGVVFLEDKRTHMRRPLVIAEIKRQGTNDQRLKEGMKKQATGNAIERLGKNLTGIKAMMNHSSITPFVCFGSGCDFAVPTVLAKVCMLNEFYALNHTYVFKRDGNADHNRYSPVSMYFREQEWTVDEMAAIMNEIAETAFRVYMF